MIFLIILFIIAILSLVANILDFIIWRKSRGNQQSEAVNTSKRKRTVL